MFHLFCKSALLSGAELGFLVLEQSRRRAIVPFLFGHRFRGRTKLVFLIAEEARERFAWRFVLAQLCGRGLFLSLGGQRAANREQPDPKQNRRAHNLHEIYLTVGKSIPIGLAFPIFLSNLGRTLAQAVCGPFVSAFLGTDKRIYRTNKVLLLMSGKGVNQALGD